MKSIFLIVIIVLFIIIVISTIYSRIKLDISRYNIKNKKIDKNLKIVFLSDLHNRNIKEKIVKILEEEKPDLVIHGGDMVNERLTETSNFISLCDAIKDKQIYVIGNHETALEDDFNDYKKVINKMNIEFLFNNKKKLSNNIDLYGFVSDYECYKKFHVLCLSKEYIEEKIGKLDNSKFNILIAHNPLEFESYVDYGADLVLSGHVHGGIITLPIFGALLSPDFTFFPKYWGGEYNKNKTKMIVSRGIGFSKRIPFRINNPGEIVIINLIKE